MHDREGLRWLAHTRSLAQRRCHLEKRGAPVTLQVCTIVVTISVSTVLCALSIRALCGAENSAKAENTARAIRESVTNTGVRLRS